MKLWTGQHQAVMMMTDQYILIMLRLVRHNLTTPKTWKLSIQNAQPTIKRKAMETLPTHDAPTYHYQKIPSMNTTIIHLILDNDPPTHFMR